MLADHYVQRQCVTCPGFDNSTGLANWI